MTDSFYPFLPFSFLLQFHMRVQYTIQFCLYTQMFVSVNGE